MNRVLIYRQMAAKWLEIAEHTPNAGLKRCYMRRAMAYRTLGASSKKYDCRRSTQEHPASPPHGNETGSSYTACPPIRAADCTNRAKTKGRHIGGRQQVG